MSEISVQFKNQLNGYNKEEVNRVLEKIEEELQMRATTIDELQQQIAGLEARLEAATTPEKLEAAEKIALYDQLMKKMDGEFKNLLAPAIAKAKAIEEKAEHDYELRMEQARSAADAIYALTADRIADVVDQNMDRLYDLLEEFIYSKSFPGRVEAFVRSCKAASAKVATGFSAASQLPKKACSAISTRVQEKVEQVKTAVHTYRQKRAVAESAVEDAE